MNDTPNFESDPESDGQRPPAITRYLKIPKILQSVEKEAPFDKCLKCGISLLNGNHHYVIEKVIRRNEVIIEMAMCLNCRGDQAEEGMSEKSAQQMKNFLTGKLNFQSRLELMSHVNDMESIDPWLERCILSDELGSMSSEYQLVALCKGPFVQRDFYPVLVSGKAMEEMAQLLSPETRDWMNDFVGDNFGMPSEFCNSPVSPVLL